MAEITRQRFELALTHLKGSDWERFEQLAAAFLADEWPQIRTMASYSGDGGRDGELFSATGTPTVAIQYSLRDDWDAKIRETVQRLNEKFPNITLLVYLTNKVIGAQADKVRKEALEKGIYLDVRDLSWFAERANYTPNRSAAAEHLAQIIVDPLLSRSQGAALGNVFTRQEANTALTFLELQLSDDNRDKGLTRSSFEALVRAALKDTDGRAGLTYDELLKKISEFMPKYSPEALDPYVRSALNRLSRSAVDLKSDNTYSLREEERKKLLDLAAEQQILNDEFDEDIYSTAETLGVVRPSLFPALSNAVRTVIGRAFLAKGEEFATAITLETDIRPSRTDVTALVTGVVSGLGNTKFVDDLNNADFLIRLIDNLLRDASDATKDYLQRLSDSYTLFAFLEETPDVQKATSKLFSQADIFLDTNVLLPVFAEAAFPSSNRPFTSAFKQARRAGMKFFISNGVLEEIERHLNKSFVYTISSDWEGRAPYVISQYLLAGRAPETFKGWLEQFCGRHDPLRDLELYLSEEFGIKVLGDEDPGDLRPELISAVREYWTEVQDHRRSGERFNMAAHRLATHDSDNYLAVLQRRRRTRAESSLGYKAWWLTMDHAAWMLLDRIDLEVAADIGNSPLMSIDFLLKYLAFGPNRSRVETSELAHTILFGSELIEAPKDLLEVARDVRAKFAGMPDRVLQRKIRDGLDKRRATAGPIQAAGLEGMAKALGELF